MSDKTQGIEAAALQYRCPEWRHYLQRIRERYFSNLCLSDIVKPTNWILVLLWHRTPTELHQTGQRYGHVFFVIMSFCNVTNLVNGISVETITRHCVKAEQCVGMWNLGIHKLCCDYSLNPLKSSLIKDVLYNLWCSYRVIVWCFTFPCLSF